VVPTEEQITTALKAACFMDTPLARRDMKNALIAAASRAPNQKVLYVFTSEEPRGVYVSNLDPDQEHDDWSSVVESEGFLIPFSKTHKTSLETEANIIRNKLANGGAQVVMR
jgi:hypothetical protein